MDVTSDAKVGRRATRQHGLLTRSDALSLGLSQDQIDWRLRTGRWRRVASGVYVIAGAPSTWQQDALAACLAAQEDVVASHLTAAALWGLGPPSLLPHITVPPGANTRVAGARAHRSRIGDVDRTTIGSIPVTRVARSLIDCAAVAGPDALRSIIDAAFDRGRATPLEVGQALRRCARVVPGRRALREAMEPWTAPIKPGSPAEARLLRRLDQWGFAPPTRQHGVLDGDGATIGRIDLAWLPERVGVEYDGSIWQTPRQLEHDEARHAAIGARGWKLIHTDRLDLRPGDDRLKRELQVALQQRLIA